MMRGKRALRLPITPRRRGYCATMWLSPLVGVALLVGGLSRSAPALACSCDIITNKLLPYPDGEGGPVDVARNAQPLLWNPVPHSGTPGLRSADGQTTPAIEIDHFDAVGDERVYTLIPSGLLPADTTWIFTWEGESEGMYLGIDEPWFTTGDWIDEVAPNTPVFEELETYSQVGGWMGACGPSKHIWMDLYAGDDGEDVSFEVELSRNDDFDDPERYRFLYGSAGIGQGGCGPHNKSNLRRGHDYSLRARAVDLAGNRSGWSQTESIRVDVCGCATSSGDAGDSTVTWFAACGVLCLLRRREASGRGVCASAASV